MDLATLSAGTIYAIDNDVPFLKTKYQNDAEAREVIANEVLEIDLFRKYSDDYGYVFYFMQKQ